MKTLFVFLVVLSFAFFFGCQSSITDPEVPDNGNYLNTPTEENVAYKDVISTYPGVIELHRMLFDPSHAFNSFAEIKGVVRYKIENVGFDKTSPNHEIRKNVSLYIDAKLYVNCPHNHKIWTVNSFANEVVRTAVGFEPTYFIEKTFRVCNTCCAPLNLIIKFQVDGKELKLSSMILKKVNGLLPIVNQF